MDAAVRDAVEDDADTLGSIVDLPEDVLRNVIHDRTVRLAVDYPGESGPHDDTGAGDDAESVLGFVAFDVRDSTVHVTQLAGDADVAERLLAEPVRFAVSENFDVAFVVPNSDADAVAAAEAAGFTPVGSGPSFDGDATTRYRFQPSE